MSMEGQETEEQLLETGLHAETRWPEKHKGDAPGAQQRPYCLRVAGLRKDLGLAVY